MSKITSQILESFDALSLPEQHEVLTEMLRRVRELPEGLLTEDQLRICEGISCRIREKEPRTKSAEFDR